MKITIENMARKGRKISEYTQRGKETWERIMLDTYTRLFAKSVDKNGEPGDFMRLCAEAPLVNDLYQSPDYNKRYYIDFGGLPLSDSEKFRIKRDINRSLWKGYKIEIPFMDYEITMMDEYEVYKAISEEYNMTKEDLKKLKMTCDMGCSPKLKDFDVKYSVMAEIYDKINDTKRDKKQNIRGERKAGRAGQGGQETVGVEIS